MVASVSMEPMLTISVAVVRMMLDAVAGSAPHRCAARPTDKNGKDRGKEDDQRQKFRSFVSLHHGDDIDHRPNEDASDDTVRGAEAYFFSQGNGIEVGTVRAFQGA